MTPRDLLADLSRILEGPESWVMRGKWLGEHAPDLRKALGAALERDQIASTLDAAQGKLTARLEEARALRGALRRCLGTFRDLHKGLREVEDVIEETERLVESDESRAV